MKECAEKYREIGRREEIGERRGENGRGGRREERERGCVYIERGVTKELILRFRKKANRKSKV